MKILSIHPKYYSDDRLNNEHDFLHELYDALSAEGAAFGDHKDYFRYNGRRGLLYLRHRMLVEEMITRGLSHTSLIDRREIEADEWSPLDTADDEIYSHRDLIREEGPPGRVPILDGDDADTLIGRMELSSALIGVTEHEILIGLWKRYKHLVMERSYSRYRNLTDPIQGEGKGQKWILFDMMIEEAFAADPDDRAPGISYETIWEQLEDRALPEETARFGELLEALEPGKISLEMREFLAGVASRCGDEELLKSQLFKAYL